MAFTTTTGAGGTSLIGTSGVDTLNLGANSYPLYIGAQGAGDLINLQGNISSVDANLGEGGDAFSAGLNAISASTIRGNDGNDTISTAALTDAALINGNAGQDTLTVGGNMAKAARVLAGADNDTISIGTTVVLSDGAIVNGNDDKDVITYVNTGTDMSKATLFGGQGSDTLDASNATKGVIMSGDVGADTVIGGAGADNLFGGDGADIISASATKVGTAYTYGIDAVSDTLTGGAGADTFRAVGNTDATKTTNVGGVTVSTGADIVTDFSVAEDKIFLNTAVLYGGAITDGNLAGKTGLYAISGTYTNAGVFTVAAQNAGGFSTIIAQLNGGVIQDTNTKAILANVLAGDVVAGNFLI